jgi:hypothetical protein
MGSIALHRLALPDSYTEGMKGQAGEFKGGRRLCARRRYDDRWRYSPVPRLPVDLGTVVSHGP